MRISFAIAAVVLALSTNAYGRGIIGDGGQSCGAWTEERARDSRSSEYMKVWVLGYVSGVNMHMGDNYPNIIGGGVDASAIWAWIDNYCRAHPLEIIQGAAIKLVEELLRGAGQVKP